ncbi:LytR/AlgR family response regulator transcription factor [Croceicoccus hydrothermalis]|uniref:LytR/AlgR family response regulator transcription factor n=1 Tax=Croceicoccus hydrothermalis TaxID=2867964 RepID=UPI001EFAD9A0|nr:LytTR family DNA-binding domain-containing protein [Croceicoccus hydrothermalis]
MSGEAGMLQTLIVDDEPLAIERLQVICARIETLRIVGTAADGAAALRMIEALRPDLVLLDMTMPELDGLSVARHIARATRDATLDAPQPAVIFVTAHDSFAVEAFDLDAVDYVLKPVAADRLERAVTRALSRRDGGADRGRDGQNDDRPGKPGGGARGGSVGGEAHIDEFWVPHRSELLRIAASDVQRIDAERDYVRLHVGEVSYLLLETISGLEERLSPSDFIRVHRSTMLRRDFITGLRHEGLGVWCAELADDSAVRIGRTYLKAVKAMAGR